MTGQYVSQISIRTLEAYSIEKYRDVPSLPTIMHAADQKGNEEVHCVLTSFVGPPQPGVNPLIRDFIVPEQKVHMVEDPEYGLFSVIRVYRKEGSPLYALITSARSRMGFLLSVDKVKTEESKTWGHTTDKTKRLQTALSTNWFPAPVPA